MSRKLSWIGGAAEPDRDPEGDFPMQKQIYLIAGLGNPGPEYASTYHNCGWMAVDYIADQSGIRFNRIRHQGVCGTGTIAGRSVILVKPMTYMNRSGDCIRPLADYYRIPHERIAVIYDDIDLPFGTLKIRRQGGAGTHNGMKSVVARLAGTDFPRFRIGIGPKPPQWDIVDYVLSGLPPERQETLETVLKQALGGVEYWLQRDIQFAMNRIN